jgi:hypothetical protein
MEKTFLERKWLWGINAQLSHKICFLKWERVIFCKIILCSSSFRLKRNPFTHAKGFRWMCKRVQTAPEGQEGLKAPQVHRPVVSPLKEDAAPGGLPQKSSPERAAEYSKICFFSSDALSELIFILYLHPGIRGLSAPYPPGCVPAALTVPLPPWGCLTFPWWKIFPAQTLQKYPFFEKLWDSCENRLLFPEKRCIFSVKSQELYKIPR